MAEAIHIRMRSRTGQPCETNAGEADDAIWVRGAEIDFPSVSASVIYCHMTPGFRTFALLTAIRAANPAARIVLMGEPARRAIDRPVARLLAALFDEVRAAPAAPMPLAA